MSELEIQMNRAVGEFVAAITALAKKAAIETLQTSLDRGGRSNGFVQKGMKRDTTEIERLSESFKAFVSKHPGQRIEQINQALGTHTKQLALPVRKLVADGVIKTKGKRRATTYFAA